MNKENLPQRWLNESLGTMTLALSLATYKIGLVYYLLRNDPKATPLFIYLAFAFCIAATALALSFLEKRVTAAASRAWAYAVFFLIIAPAVCSTFAYFYAGMGGNPAINAVQAVLWAVPIPVGLGLFFRHVAPRRLPLCFALGLSAAYLTAAILLPLVNETKTLSAEQAKNWIPLLHLLRNGCTLIMALLAVHLLRDASSDELRPAPQPVSAPSRRLLFLLAAVMLCSFSRSFLFLDQFVMAAAQGEMAHLIAGFLFLALGFAIARREAFLLYLLCAHVLTEPLLAVFAAFAGNSDIIRLLADVNYRLLLFSGTLTAGRLAGSFRYPALVCSSVYLVFFLSAAGKVFGFGLHSLSSSAGPAVLGLLCALCAAWVLPLRRIFPLPAPPLPNIGPETETHGPNNAAGREKLLAEHGLTDREKEVANLLISGLSSRNMAEALFLSENTVNTHIKSILRKLGVSGRKAVMALFTQ